jgi:hypothetical protein
MIIRLVLFYYALVFLASFLLIVTVIVDTPRTKLPCREVGKECRRW